MNKMILAALVLIAVASQVNSQCMKLIPAYHGCFNPDATLDDNYYKNFLENIKTFDDAMELFRAYYQAVVLTCQTPGPICECFVSEMLNTPQYGVLFTNNSHFNDIKRLASLVKYSKYTLRSMDDINKDPSGPKPFSFDTPTLNDFCHKYDYSNHMDYFYTELKSCKTSGQTSAIIKCIPSVIFSDDATESYLKCVYSYRKCDIELKNFLALGDVAQTPSIIKGPTLYTYIESLTNDSSSLSARFSFSFVFSLLLISFYSIY